MQRRWLHALLTLNIGVLGVAPGLAQQSPEPAATFTKDIAPILYAKCVQCHREGAIAPMSLMSYAETRPWSRAIKQRVLAREMPPWHADPEHGRFQNDPTLTEREIEAISSWVDSGSPEGNPGDLPPRPDFPDGWVIGTPDAVLEIPEPFKVPAEGAVAYQHFVIPTNFTEDKWIERVQVLPTNPAVVHHVGLHAREPNPDPDELEYPGLGIDKLFSTPPPRISPFGNVVLAAGVGTEPPQHGEGAGLLVRAASELTLEVHYVTIGTPEVDQTRIGFVFADAPPANRLRTIPILNTEFMIPAGAADYEVTSEVTFTEDALIWTLFPHMHMRGKTFEYVLVHPDGSTEVLLSVPRYDFNWQRDYFLEEPIKAPAGSRLVVTGVFDNSPANRFNPDPTSPVSWGEQTWEEMMIGFATYSLDPDS